MTNTSSPRPKSHASTRPIWQSGAPSPASQGAPDDRHHDGLSGQRSASAHGGSRSAQRPRIQADRHRLRLLDLHPQRHGDVLGLLRYLCRSARADGGRPQRTRPVRPAQCRDRNRFPAGVELYLRPCHDRGRYAQPSLVPGFHGRHLCLWPRLSHDRSPGIREPRGTRRRAVAQRLSVGVLYAGGHPRAARLGRYPVALDDHGAGRRQGVQGGHPAPHPVLCAVLARARHHLDRRVHGGVFDRKCSMSNGHDDVDHGIDLPPGDEYVEGGSIALRVLGYLTGLALAILLTATSFFVAGTDLVWEPSIPVALAVLAIAQMGVHLVFFLHITTGPDNTNNVLALAFGILIVLLVMAGSLWIMGHMNQNMMPMDQIMQMQR